MNEIKRLENALQAVRNLGAWAEVSQRNGRMSIRIIHADMRLFDSILRIAERHNLCLADVHSN